MDNYLLNIFIVRNGYGSKIVNASKKYGVSGGTVFLGTGTFKNKFLDFFELNETSKEVVMLLSKKRILFELSEELKLKKKKIGVSFSIGIDSIIGSINFTKPELNGGKMMDNHKSIIVIVDKGRGAKVVDTALEAGASGATIINARGSGIHETTKLFSSDIEPEKEIVLMIIDEKIKEAVVKNIEEKMELGKPGKGILFTQDICETYGIK